MKTAMAIVLMLLVLYGALGAVHINPMDGGGLSGGCPFMPGVNLCDMTPLAHLAAWQDSFVALAPASIGTLLAFALAALFLAFLFSTLLLPLLSMPQPVRVATLQPARRALHDAFSDGILNPKIF